VTGEGGGEPCSDKGTCFTSSMCFPQNVVASVKGLHPRCASNYICLSKEQYDCLLHVSWKRFPFTATCFKKLIGIRAEFHISFALCFGFSSNLLWPCRTPPHFRLTHFMSSQGSSIEGVIRLRAGCPKYHGLFPGRGKRFASPPARPWAG
jgi:hypothetical protein